MQDVTEPTYTNRYVQQSVVGKIDGNAISDTDGWTANAPEELARIIKVGDPYEIEMVGGPFRPISGWRFRGTWYRHDSDQEIQAERTRWEEERDREHREMLDEHRSEWIGRTEMLPGWLQERIQFFRERGGEYFELNGWGYELCIAELAVLYDKDPNFGPRETYTYSDEYEPITEYAKEHGTSGNQHDCARALVLHHRAGNSLAGTVGGLSPITGDAFYEGTG